jgi:hypothetical protein
MDEVQKPNNSEKTWKFKTRSPVQGVLREFEDDVEAARLFHANFIKVGTWLFTSPFLNNDPV